MVFFKSTNKTNVNIGLLLSVIVLLVVLLANFDKCFAPLADFFKGGESTIVKSNNNINKIPTPNSSTPVSVIKEGFTGENTIKLTERNVVINPDNETVTVKFERPNPGSDKGYLLILSKYDSNLKKVGNLDIKIADAETNIDAKPTTTSTITTTTIALGKEQSNEEKESEKYKYEAICNSSNICEYTFTNVEGKDKEGNLFYYRLGIGIITANSTGNIVSDTVSMINEFKFGSGSGLQRFFRVDNTLKEQKALLDKLNNLEKIRAVESAKSTQDLVDETSVDETGDIKYDVDAYMKMLKPYIGNYPDEFKLNQQKLDELSLGKYLDKSMALGVLNVNVDVADIMSKPPTTN